MFYSKKIQQFLLFKTVGEIVQNLIAINLGGNYIFVVRLPFAYFRRSS